MVINETEKRFQTVRTCDGKWTVEDTVKGRYCFYHGFREVTVAQAVTRELNLLDEENKTGVFTLHDCADTNAANVLELVKHIRGAQSALDKLVCST